MASYEPRELMLGLRGLIAAILSYSAAEGRRLGLSLIEIAALEHLQHAGELTPGQLGERLALSSGTVTGVVDRLERAGFLERLRHPQDRRSVVIRPLGPRTEAVQQERAAMSAELLALVQGLGPEERAAVGRYLAGVAAAIGRGQGRDPAGTGGPGMVQ